MKTVAKRHHDPPNEAVRKMMARFGLETPGPMEILEQLRRAATGDRAVDRKTKALVALAICVAARRDDCIAEHVHDALGAGASRPEILETVGTAMLVGGRRSMPCGSEAVAALDHLEPGRWSENPGARGGANYRISKNPVDG